MRFTGVPGMGGGPHAGDTPPMVRCRECSSVPCLAQKSLLPLQRIRYDGLMPKGSPGQPRARQLPVEERFWRQVDRHGFADCWPWLGALRKGYGSFKLGIGDLGAEKRRDVYAHRVAFRLVYGHWPEPDGLHGCDNPPCCNAENPEHVHEGTQLLNEQEKYARGRAIHPAGERSARAVLTDAQAQTIRERCASGLPQHVVAAEFGVSQITVSRIVRGLRYAEGGGQRP